MTIYSYFLFFLLEKGVASHPIQRPKSAPVIELVVIQNWASVLQANQAFCNKPQFANNEVRLRH